MEVVIRNKGSFGGEMVIIDSPPEGFWDDCVEHGVRVMSNETQKWFLAIDIPKVKSGKFAQKLIDIVEEEDMGDYEIGFNLDYIEPVKVKQFRYKR